MARDDGLSIRAIGPPYLAGAFLGFALGALAGLLWGLIRAAMWRPAPNADEWRRHDPNREGGGVCPHCGHPRAIINPLLKGKMVRCRACQQEFPA